MNLAPYILPATGFAIFAAGMMVGIGFRAASGRAPIAPDILAPEAHQLGPPRISVAQYIHERSSGVEARTALLRYEVELEHQRYRAFGAILTAAAAKSVAVVPPVPAYFYDAFLAQDGAALVQLDHHPAPPHVRSLHGKRFFSDANAGRQFARNAEVLVFDAYAKNDVFVRRSIADLLMTIGPDVALYAHRRPHLDHDDVPIPPDVGGRITFI